jgi:hypothetical protein
MEPLAAEARLGICSAALGMGRIREARDCMAEIEDRSWRASLIEAQLMCLEGQFRQAEDVFARAEKKAPAARIAIARIQCDIGRGDREQARKKLAELEQKPEARGVEKQLRVLEKMLEKK